MTCEGCTSFLFQDWSSILSCCEFALCIDELISRIYASESCRSLREVARPFAGRSELQLSEWRGSRFYGGAMRLNHLAFTRSSSCGRQERSRLCWDQLYAPTIVDNIRNMNKISYLCKWVWFVLPTGARIEIVDREANGLLGHVLPLPCDFADFGKQTMFVARLALVANVLGKHLERLLVVSDVVSQLEVASIRRRARCHVVRWVLLLLILELGHLRRARTTWCIVRWWVRIQFLDQHLKIWLFFIHSTKLTDYR